MQPTGSKSWFTWNYHFGPSRQFYPASCLQTGFSDLRRLWHTVDLALSDMELLPAHRQFAVMLAEKVRTQDTVGIISIDAGSNLVFVRPSRYSYLNGSSA